MQVQIKASHGDFSARLKCSVLPTVMEPIPQMEIDASKIIIPRDVQLADPGYDKPGGIDLLIGATLYWKIIIGAPRNRLRGQPALQNTQLGWILGGEFAKGESSTSSTCLTNTNTQLHQQMERFWIQEVIPEAIHLTKEEKWYEKHFSKTVQRETVQRLQWKIYRALTDTIRCRTRTL